MAKNVLQTDSPAMLLCNYASFSLFVCAVVHTSLFMSACCNKYSRVDFYLPTRILSYVLLMGYLLFTDVTTLVEQRKGEMEYKLLVRY